MPVTTGARRVGNFANTAVAPNTNFFSAAIAHPGDGRDAVKYTIFIMLSAAGKAALMLSSTASLPNARTAVSMLLNSGNDLVAASLYGFDVVLGPGDSFNLQHKVVAGADTHCIVYEHQGSVSLGS